MYAVKTFAASVTTLQMRPDMLSVSERVCVFVSEWEREREREDEEDQEKLPDNFKGAEMGEEGWIFAAYFRAGKKLFLFFVPVRQIAIPSRNTTRPFGK